MLEAAGVSLVVTLAAIGVLVAVNGIRLWHMKRQWRKWGTK